MSFSVYIGLFWTYPKDRSRVGQRTMKYKSQSDSADSATVYSADSADSATVEIQSHEIGIEIAPPQLCGKGENSPKPGQEIRAELAC
jgi:hypothetical protein